MYSLSFNGYKPITKQVDIDFYTGKFVDIQHRTIEHILPKSKGGKSKPENYAMTDVFINSQRSNKSLNKWVLIHPEYLQNMKNYIKRYWNLKINGKNHGQEVFKTVKKYYGINLII